MTIRTRLKLAAGLAAICFSVGSASAGTVPAAQTIAPGYGDTTWYLDTHGPAAPFSGSCYGATGSGFLLDDADSPDGNSDAYDGGWAIFVNGTPFVAPGGSVDLTGTTVTAGPSTIAGLQVSIQHFFTTGSAVDRILVTLRNPGLVGIPATVEIPTNFGSDASTFIRGTSSGDLVVTTADRWVVSSEGNGAEGGDPVNTSVFYGPGSPAVTPTSYTQSVCSSAGTQGLGATFNLTVSAGGTRSLMFFAGLGGIAVNNNLIASAVSSAALFNSNGTLLPEWLSGLSPTQKSQIANWSFSSSCAGAGYSGTKLTLCKQACESGATGPSQAGLAAVFAAIYRSGPFCGL